MPRRNLADDIEKSLLEKTPRRKPIPDDAWLSFGVVLMNLAVSGQHDRGLAKGTYLWFVGDSESGKTWITLMILAEAARNPNFDGYRLIYDPVENGAMIDIPKYFGVKLANRVEPPRGTRREPQPSRNVQELYYTLRKMNKEGSPFIYVVDSMDALDDKTEEQKFDDNLDAHEKGKEEKGSFAMSKQKYNSQNIKRVITAMARNGSILVVISQTRANIASPIPGQKSVGGGYALKFFAHCELWTTLRGSLKRNVMGKDRKVGEKVQFEVKKNRVTGRHVKVDVPFIWDFGFDDVGASVDFLVEEGYWKKAGTTINAKEFNLKLRREELVEKIQAKEGGEEKLASLVQFHWKTIAEAMKVRRKKKYE